MKVSTITDGTFTPQSLRGVCIKILLRSSTSMNRRWTYLWKNSISLRGQLYDSFLPFRDTKKTLYSALVSTTSVSVLEAGQTYHLESRIYHRVLKQTNNAVTLQFVGPPTMRSEDLRVLFPRGTKRKPFESLEQYKDFVLDLADFLDPECNRPIVDLAHPHVPLSKCSPLCSDALYSRGHW